MPGSFGRLLAAVLAAPPWVAPPFLLLLAPLLCAVVLLYFSLYAQDDSGAVIGAAGGDWATRLRGTRGIRRMALGQLPPTPSEIGLQTSGVNHTAPLYGYGGSSAWFQCR